MSKYSLTHEAKAVALELDRRVRDKTLERDINYIVNNFRQLYPHNETAKANADLSINHGGIMSYAELSELVRAGLVHQQHMSNALYTFRILQSLHDAVASNFQLPSSSTNIAIDNANITISKAYFNDLANDPNKLADTLIERLVPFLQQQTAFNSIELQELRDAIEALRNAVDEAAVEDASSRIWKYIDRTSAVVGIITAVALGLPG